MKMRYKIFHEYYSNKIARKGIGPLIPSTAISFLSGRCANCGEPISDFTILGNALVLEDSGIINLKCLDCRIGGNLHVKKPGNLRGCINKNIILLDLNERIIKHKIMWIQMIIAWQKNYGLFQDEINFDKAYDIKFQNTVKDYLYSNDPLYLGFEYEATVKTIYGNIEAINSCGECGAFWSNNYNKKKIPNLLKDGRCWHCMLPHEFQWNMRTSLNKEMEKIKKITFNDT